MLVAACGSSLNGLATGGASTVYVLQTAISVCTVLEFSANSKGNQNPPALTLPANFAAWSIAVDGAGLIYVGGNSNAGSEVLVYGAGASGSPQPLKVITSTLNSFVDPEALAVDDAGQLYVGGESSIAVYSPSANGAATPLRVISGAGTGIFDVSQMATDSSGNLYVTTKVSASIGKILVFASNAGTNAAPMQSITFNGGAIYGLSVDEDKNIYATEDLLTNANGYTGGASVVEFAAGASGAAVPVNVISGLSTGLGLAAALHRDAAGNLYVMNGSAEFGPGASYSVMGFLPSAAGDSAAAATFSSSALTSPTGDIAIR
jgi:hypothetical protein